MKKVAAIILAVFSLSIFTGCLGLQAHNGQSNVGYCALMGAGAGAAIGAATRAKKPLKNSIIGAVLGAIGGAFVCDVLERTAQQAAIEAARTQRTVQYQTSEGQTVRATPVSYNAANSCHEIVNEAWDTDGTSLGQVRRMVCPGQTGPEIRS